MDTQHVTPAELERVFNEKYILSRVTTDGTTRYWSPVGEFKSRNSAAVFNTRAYVEATRDDFLRDGKEYRIEVR